MKKYKKCDENPMIRDYPYLILLYCSVEGKWILHSQWGTDESRNKALDKLRSVERAL